jgi:acyl carrier protein
MTRREGPVSPDRAALLRDLQRLIIRNTPGLTGPLGENTPLISSGVLESTTLVSVAVWVEDRIGKEMDLSAFDLAAEWDSLNAIVDFVERHAAGSDRPAAGSAPGRV